MGGGVDIRVHTDILKADLPADERAAPVVTQHIEAAAGAHTYNRSLALRKCGEGGNAGIKVCHQAIYRTFQPEHRRDRGGIAPNTLDKTNLYICRQKDNRRDLAERIIGLAQPPTDEDHIRLTGHHSLQISFLDRAEIGDAVIGDIALQIV